jgi:hypothetical protein
MRRRIERKFFDRSSHRNHVEQVLPGSCFQRSIQQRPGATPMLDSAEGGPAEADENVMLRSASR